MDADEVHWTFDDDDDDDAAMEISVAQARCSAGQGRIMQEF